jgi:hypothetical protein
MLMLGAVLAGLSGCERSSLGNRELPEHPDILRAGAVTPSKLLANAEEELTSRRAELLRVSPESLAGLAQADALIRALRRQEAPSTLAPATIVASFGYDCAEQAYVTVIALAPCREISGVRFVFADREGDMRSVAVKLEREFKSVDYIETHYFRRRIMGWDEMKGQISGVLSVTVRNGARHVEVPWPELDDNVTCAIAVEDRLCGIGNFITALPYDANDSEPAQTGP